MVFIATSFVYGEGEPQTPQACYCAKNTPSAAMPSSTPSSRQNQPRSPLSMGEPFLPKFLDGTHVYVERIP